MALTRKMLKAMGITDEQAEQIIEAHTEVTDALKAEKQEALAEGGKLAEVQAQLEAAQKRVQELESSNGDAQKVQAEFDAYKKQVADEALQRSKADVLGNLLTEGGITKDAVRKLIRGSYDLNKIEVDADGNNTNHDELLAGIKAEYADFIGTTLQQGTPPTNPPSSGKPALTREAIKQMTPQEINDRWDEVKTVLAQ